MMLLTASVLFAPASAQTKCSDVVATEDCSEFMQEYEIFFRFDKTDVDVNYLSNAQNIASIRHYLANSHRVDSITIYSYASPEGIARHNRELAEGRAYAAKNILLQHSPDSSVLSSDMIRVCPLSENWPGLIKEVEKRYRRHDRDRVLRILKNKRISNDTRKWRLERLDGGYTWSFLRRIYMPELRVATWVCVYGDIVPPLKKAATKQIVLDAPVKELDLSRVSDRASSCHSDRASSCHSDRASSCHSDRASSCHSDRASSCHSDRAKRVEESLDKSQRTIIALKTNLLLDAVTALNYAIEVPINEHVSLQYFQTTPWWNGPGNKFCLQALTFGGEARWWFLPRTKAATGNLKQRDALVGHFLGAYGWGGNGDLQLGRNICQQFDFWSAGLTYGYAMPVSKHLNMEFTISVGYANINYQHYIPTDDFSLLVRDDNLAGKLHYIGPTKAEISLVIPIRATVGKKGGKK